jgi:hypothetical protein
MTWNNAHHNRMSLNMANEAMGYGIPVWMAARCTLREPMYTWLGRLLDEHDRKI